MKTNKLQLKLTSFLLALLSVPTYALAEPSDNQIKGWITTNKVLLEKRKLLPDKYEELDISKISNIKEISTATERGIMNSTALMKITFEYDYDGYIPCDASVTYKWTTLKSNYQLQNIIATCDRLSRIKTR